MASDCQSDRVSSGAEQQRLVHSSVHAWSPGALLYAKLKDGTYYGTITYADEFLDYVVVQCLASDPKTQEICGMKSWAGTGDELSKIWSFARHLGAS
jgi:hypothetical protein